MITYINGIIATKNDILELERRLRLGIERATARCCGGFIYIKTM